MQKRLILASGSPRRRELMAVSGYFFEVITSKTEEICAGMPAPELVLENACRKAKSVLETHPECVVLGADTVVAVGEEILGKPRDASDAKRMLMLLSGSEHTVLTGVAVVSGSGESRAVCKTAVKFRELTEREIDDYIATGEPLDKAGAYGIQERASVFVESIRGDFFNVVGLPVSVAYSLLSEHGIFPNWHN